VLQYQILQEPRIQKYISANRVELLNDAIQSHRFALSLNQENADILFNTAQVLTTAAEVAQESKDGDGQWEAVALLKEAVELFSSCLSRQELEFSESQMRAQEVEAEVDLSSQPEHEGEGEGGVQLERMSTSSSSQAQQEWATVIEPVIARTLVDTALAELAALTTLVSLTSSSNNLDSNSDYRAFAAVASTLTQQKLPQYIALIPTTAPESEVRSLQPSRFLSLSDTTPTLHVEQPPEPTNPQAEAKHETELASAVFAAALADAEYRSHLYPARTYFDRLFSLFNLLEEGSSAHREKSVQVYSALADALVTFAATVEETILAADPSQREYEDAQSLRWEALSRGASLLAETVTMLNAGVKGDDLPSSSSVDLLRGDIELLRRRILLDTTAASMVIDSAGNSAENLLTMAAHYYTEAYSMRSGSAPGNDEEEKEEARVKGAVCAVIMGAPPTAAIDILTGEKTKVGDLVDEMLEEGLLGDADRNRLVEVMG
jgi:hypothetical protein